MRGERRHEKNATCGGEEKLHMVDGGAAKVGLKLVWASSIGVGRSEAWGRHNTGVGGRR